MRQLSNLFPYNRQAARKDKTSEMGKSMLAYLATGESRLLISFLEWSAADATDHSRWDDGEPGGSV